MNTENIEFFPFGDRKVYQRSELLRINGKKGVCNAGFAYKLKQDTGDKKKGDVIFITVTQETLNSEDVESWELFYAKAEPETE